MAELPTATAILHKTTTVVFSTRHHLRTFLILSILLFSLHLTLQHFTHQLITFIDQDPSIHSLLNQTHFPPNPQLPPKPTNHADEVVSRFFNNPPDPTLNHTFFTLNPQMGLFNIVSYNEIKVSEVMGSGFKISYGQIKNVRNKTVDHALNEFDHDHDHDHGWLFIIGVLFAAYVFMVLQFVEVHAWVYGVIFVSVANDFLKKRASMCETFINGADLGGRRLCKFFLVRLLIRDVMAQLLGNYFFRGVEDVYSLVKIMIRVKFLPFMSLFSTVLPPWVGNVFEDKIYGFVVSWLLLDMFTSFVLALAAWVAMEKIPNRTWGEVIGEGWRLLSLRINGAINLKSFEGIACGLFVRHILTRIFGGVFASMIQSFVEVYFMVAWMMFYFAVKSLDADARGVPFGSTEIKAMLQLDR